MFRVYLFLLTLLVTNFTQASELKMRYGSLHLPQAPSGWEMSHQLFGFDYVLFSPKSHGQRSSLSFQSDGVKVTHEFDLTEVSEYKKIKEEWAKKKGIELLRFHPPSVIENKYHHQVQSFSFEYRHNNHQYLETSVYVNCRSHLVMLKSLLLVKNRAHTEQINRIIERLDCEF